MSRKENHILFIEQELRAQVKDFEEKLSTNAYEMLFDSRGGLYVSKFITIQDNGELVLKMTNSRNLPRRRDYLYAFTLPDDVRSYKKWGNRTYGQLIDLKTHFSEVHCIWKSICDEGQASLVGFRGVSTEFCEYIKKSPGCIIVLGPQVPPYQYLANLEYIVNKDNPCTYDILNCVQSNKICNPTLLQSTTGNSKRIIDLLADNDTIILQGPPGTGKTQLISEVAAHFCLNNKSVLITAFTNRALMEVAEKSALLPFLQKQKVTKANLTSDEIRELSLLLPDKELKPRVGEIQLSTYYVASGVARETQSSRFDLVIMDEASQAFLGMFAASKILGVKQLWVGDTHQMPPISLQNREHIERHHMVDFVEGMNTVTSAGLYPIYQLTHTFRLPPKSTELTSIFYDGTLMPVKTIKEEQGPTLLTIPMRYNESISQGTSVLILSIIESIYRHSPKAKIAVLSQMKESVQIIDTAVFGRFGNKEHLIVDTVARVQGLTTDFVIYVIPNNESQYYSLDPKLFNVATSRAMCKTIIVADEKILQYMHVSESVARYLNNMYLCKNITELKYQ